MHISHDIYLSVIIHFVLINFTLTGVNYVNNYKSVILSVNGNDIMLFDTGSARIYIIHLSNIDDR